MKKPINIDENCQFLKDLKNNKTGVNMGVYNLICSKRDLTLFCEGIKPRQKWRLKDVKSYFGLFDTNGKEKIKSALFLLDEALNPRKAA